MIAVAVLCFLAQLGLFVASVSKSSGSRSRRFYLVVIVVSAVLAFIMLIASIVYIVGVNPQAQMTGSYYYNPLLTMCSQIYSSNNYLNQYLYHYCTVDPQEVRVHARPPLPRAKPAAQTPCAPSNVMPSKGSAGGRASATTRPALGMGVQRRVPGQPGFSPPSLIFWVVPVTILWLWRTGGGCWCRIPALLFAGVSWGSGRNWGEPAARAGKFRGGDGLSSQHRPGFWYFGLPGRKSI